METIIFATIYFLLVHPIIQLRNYYGMSQANLAIYLSVTVSLLKMVEQEKRELPTHASIKLTRLQRLTFGASHSEANPLQPLLTTNDSQRTFKELQHYIPRYEELVRKNKLLLDHMQARAQQTIHCQQLIHQLTQPSHSGEEEEKDKVWLELLQLETKEDWKRYGTAAQALLQWRTACYVYNIVEAKKILAGFTNK